MRARSTDDEIKLLKYNDEHLGGKGFVDWTPFDHPQLGKVEIGGWTHMYTFRNPPPASVGDDRKSEGLLARHHSQQLPVHARSTRACTPLLRITDVEAEALGADLYKVTAVVANLGYLPTQHDAVRALKTAWPAQQRQRSNSTVGVDMGEADARPRSSGGTRRAQSHVVALDARMGHDRSARSNGWCARPTAAQ